MIPIQLYYLLIITNILVIMAGTAGWYLTNKKSIGGVLAVQGLVMVTILIFVPYLMKFFELV